jgi:hypothetical protein
VMLRVLSLGAGVQSTTLALMAAHGELEPPDCAIFADTGWEPQAVYTHLAWLELQLPYPVHRVSAGDIRESIATGGYDPIPWHVSTGMGRRQCTKQFKLYPIRRAVRAMLGGKTPRGGCEMWVGISTNEAHRMKPSTVQYITNRWPLIEARLSRVDCIAKLRRWGVSAPRSACCGCPYLSDADWRERRLQPEWAATGQYMHRSLRELDAIDFTRWQDRNQADLFGEECEGMCGV